MTDRQSIDALNLTDAERADLAIDARYRASQELDFRNYLTGESYNGVQVLHDDWSTSQERHDRWRAIADAFDPDPWKQDGKEVI